MSANCRLLLPIFFSFILAFPIIVRARVLAGPLIGQVDLRTARIRVEAEPGDQVSTGRHQEIHSSFSQSYVPVIFGLVNLQFCTIYEYSATIDHKSAKRSVGSDGSFTIKEIWRWSKAAPDFNFPAGASACISEPAFNRPGDYTLYDQPAPPDLFGSWVKGGERTIRIGSRAHG